MTEPRSEPHPRPVLTLAGAAAGFTAWTLIERLLDWLDNPQAYLFWAAFAFGAFAICLALTGPARLRAALPVSLPPALVFAAMLWWASDRHDDAEDFLRLAYPLLAFSAALVLITPFLAAALRSRDGWRDYAALFDLSWRIFVRYVAAAIFTALVWAVLALSDALLSLVGLDFIDWLMRQEAAAWTLTGAVFGLALAVVHELRAFLSPYLVLQLLRLLIPVVLVVVSVFIVALPFRGLDGFVTGLSPAATLIGCAIASIVLVTIALDRDDAEAVHQRWMRLCVQALALLVPVLAALAIWAVWLRVGQYGWTPPRLVAGTIAGICLLYGLCYAVAVALRAGWMRRIRTANIAVALVNLVVALAWLSPAIVPEAISVRSQMARIADGRTPDDRLPLRELAQDWGRAGEQALAALGAERPDLSSAIAAARRSGPAFAPGPAAPVALVAELAEQLPVYPEGRDLPAAAYDAIRPELLRDWLAACGRSAPGGPGCALVLDSFVTGDDAERGILLLLMPDGIVRAQALRVDRGRLTLQGFVAIVGSDTDYGLAPALLGALHAGDADIAPARIRTLQIGDVELFPDN